MIPKASGKTPPATPCSTRPATSAVSESPSAHSTEPAQNTAIVHVSTRPRPSRSPIRPITGVATEAETRYAVSSHDTASGLASSERTSAGMAGRISV
jgi:hypothetical protein